MAAGGALPLLLFLSAAAAAAITTASSFGFDRAINAAAAADGDDSCVYTIYIRTGTVWKGGTDSIISLGLAGSDGLGVQITDLEGWGGQMGEGYNYFERGNLDIFAGRGPCLSTPPCWMNLTSDGSGEHHGWYCNYVEATITGPHLGCSQQQFKVEQWLATDASPYNLYAIRDECPHADGVVLQGRRGGAERD